MTIDLNQLIKDHRYEAEITPPEPEDDATLRRFEERWVFIAALAIVMSSAVALVWWLITGNPSADDKKWIFGLLGTVIGFSASVLKK